MANNAMNDTTKTLGMVLGKYMTAMRSTYC